MFERETKREKILEARHREMKLKERARSQQGQHKEEEEKGEDGEEEDLIDTAEREFYAILENELKDRKTKNVERNDAFEKALLSMHSDHSQNREEKSSSKDGIAEADETSEINSVVES